MKPINSLIKGLVLQILALTAGLLAILFLSSRFIDNPYLLRLILLAVIGLTSGLAARVISRHLPALLLFVATTVADVIAVLAIDRFFESDYQFTFLTENFQLKTPQISDISQMVLMAILAALPVFLFRKKASKTQKGANKVNQKKKSFSIDRSVQLMLKKVNPKNWDIFRGLKIQKKNKKVKPQKAIANMPAIKIPQSKPIVDIPKSISIRNAKSGKNEKKKAISPLKILKGSKSDVKLIGEEAHVCPYCLEDVLENDTRGVEICPECGTWHHLDCWNLTGSCGVAHRNEI